MEINGLTDHPEKHLPIRVTDEEEKSFRKKAVNREKGYLKNADI